MGGQLSRWLAGLLGELVNFIFMACRRIFTIPSRVFEINKDNSYSHIILSITNCSIVIGAPCVYLIIIIIIIIIIVIIIIIIIVIIIIIFIQGACPHHQGVFQ